MKAQLFKMIALAGGIMATGVGAAQAASWQYCDTDGCRQGGNVSATSTYGKTKYPIVLGQGMAGFSAVGPLQYWNGITEDLTRNGAQVFATQQASFQSSEVRGEQLLTQVKQILAITGAQKVNLIGHSHGSQSVRYVAGVLPANVASVTAVGGPTKGSPVADVVQALADSPVVGTVLAPVISAGVNAFFTLVGVGSGHYYEQDALAGLASLTTKGSAVFNARFPAGVPTTACGTGTELVNGIRYYSWSGTSTITNLFDPIDYGLAATSLLIPEANDGLVPRCSSHLGTVLRDNYAYNHLDEVNQVVGLVGFLQDPVSVYRQQANRLKNQGL